MSAVATSRRQLFGASAALLLVGTPEAGEGKARELDGGLLAACARFHAANRAAYQHAISEAEGEGDALHEALANAVDEVLSLIPRTPEGLQAKAGVAFAALMGKVRVSMSEEWRAQADPMEALALDVLAQMSGRREACKGHVS